MNRSLSGTGTQAVHHVAGWVPPLARLGYAAKGVVYGLIGGIAIKAALASGSPEGTSGALASLRDEPGGQVMLVLIAVGLLCHVLWRLVQAALDPEHDGTDAKRIAMRFFFALSALIYLSLAFTAWQLSRGGGEQGSEGGQAVWIGKLLEQPFGQWLVMLAGLGVIGYGLHQIYKAWKGDVGKRMTGSSNAEISRGMIIVGRAGIAARGVVLLPVGWFLFNAGRYYRAEQAVDTEEVLKMLGQGWLLAIVGVGLLAYGLHQIAKAVYRRIDRPQ